MGVGGVVGVRVDVNGEVKLLLKFKKKKFFWGGGRGLGSGGGGSDWGGGVRVDGNREVKLV